MDGNFEQKRCRHAQGDGVPCPHGHSFFISPDEVKEMREYVERTRGNGRKGKDYDEDEDETLPGLKLPNYLYDGCMSRFVAAKEGNQKAEKSIFADTGLMALTCRHDRILFMVNLTDAGERQYNVLALIKRLFTELPSQWQVGILYDIGCQLHKSFVKASRPSSILLISCNLMPHALNSILCFPNMPAGCILASRFSMLLATISLARASTTLKKSRALGTQTGRDVKEFGRTFKSKFQPFESQGHVHLINFLGAALADGGIMPL